MFGAAPSRTQFFGPPMLGGYSGIGGGPMQAQPMPGMFGGYAPQMGGMMPGMFGGGFANPFGGGMMQQPMRQPSYGGGMFGVGMQGGFGGGGFFPGMGSPFGQMMGQPGPQMGQFGGQMPQAGSILDAQRAARQAAGEPVRPGQGGITSRPPSAPSGLAAGAAGMFRGAFGGQAPQIRRPTQMGIGSMPSPFMGVSPRQAFGSMFRMGGRGFFG